MLSVMPYDVTQRMRLFRMSRLDIRVVPFPLANSFPLFCEAFGDPFAPNPKFSRRSLALFCGPFFPSYSVIDIIDLRFQSDSPFFPSLAAPMEQADRLPLLLTSFPLPRQK